MDFFNLFISIEYLKVISLFKFPVILSVLKTYLGIIEYFRIYIIYYI
jgi:hypothetical protein